MGKRLKSIRRGILYQDLVAAEAMLSMVTEADAPPVSVSLEDRAGGTFDDVVVRYADRAVYQQVKWAENPGAEPLTIDFLTSLNRSRRTPLIKSFADSYSLLQASGAAFRAELITNRAPDTELRAVLKGNNSGIKRRLTKSQRDRLETDWRSQTNLNKREFGDFLRSIAFLVNSPDISRLEKDLRRQLKLLHCSTDAFDKLMRAIQDWALDDTKDRITQADIEELLTPVSATPPNAFDLPENRVDRSELKAELGRRIDAAESGYIVVFGPPGSGKSTLLNTLHEGNSLSDGREVIVYNCFTGTSDQFVRTRALADNFARFLSRELSRQFFDFGRMFAPGPDSLDSILARLSRCLKRRKAVLVIDGLDYARRFASNHSRNLIDSLPINLPQGVICVVSAQVAEQLPEHLRNLARREALRVPLLDLAQVQQLIDNRDLPVRLKLNPVESENLARRILGRTSGHALLVNYAVRQVDVGTARGRTVTELVDDFPRCEGDVNSYYESIFSPPKSTLARDTLNVMAASPFELRAAEIAGILGNAIDERAVEDQLLSLSHLFEATNDTYHFQHDSLRAFALARHDRDVFSANSQIGFLLQQDDDPRAGEHLLHLIAEEGGPFPTLTEVDCGWLARQIAAGANTALLREGLEKLAVSALHHDDWRQMARWVALKSCLEKAEFEGELYEATLVDAWLAMGRTDIVERYIVVTSQYLSTVYPGPDLIDLLNTHEQGALASRVADYRLSQTIPSLERLGPNPEFERYVRHLAARMNPESIVTLVRKKAEEVLMTDPDPMLQTVDGHVENFAKVAAYECLSDGLLDRVDEWLRLKPRPFSEEVASDLTFRSFLVRRASDASTKVPDADLELIDDISLLAELYEYEEFHALVQEEIPAFNLSPLLSDNYEWYNTGTSAPIRRLYDDLFLSHCLGLKGRCEQIETTASRQSNQVARAFNRGLCSVAELLAENPKAWNETAEAVSQSCDALRRRYRLDVKGVQAAHFFVCSLGTYLEPIARSAKSSGEADGFGQWLVTGLLPTLKAAGFGYEGGLLSAADMLHSKSICPGIVLALLIETEKLFGESVSFKSGSLIDLSARFARAGDHPSAQRTLVAGVRAAFTYGYHKDTTINYFILAIEAVAEHVGDRFTKIVEFTTSLLLLLDNLTDGRMICGAPAHFIAVVAKVDVGLAARVASRLQSDCRQLGGAIAPAIKDHGLDVRSVRAKFKKLAPEVELGKVKQDEDARAYFVVDEAPLPSAPNERRAAIQDLVESRGYGVGLLRLTSVVQSLIAEGRVQDGVAVFDEIEKAMRTIVSTYPLPAAAV